MGCSVSKDDVVPPGNGCEPFDRNAMAHSSGPRKLHLKLSLEEDADNERADALARTIKVSLSNADECIENVETPRIGRLEKGGRRTSAYVREAPALPLSPGSRLRAGSLGRRKLSNLDNPPNGWLLIHCYAEMGHLEGVKSQLSGEGFGSKSSCLDARTSDRNRFTPFYLVARSGRTQIVKWLKERGCTISTPDAEGKSPLYVACSCGRRETSHAIIEMGASIEQAANDGTTPLWAAALAGRSGTVELLLHNLANLNIKHKDGRGILWASGAGGSEEVVDLLLMFKSKLNLEMKCKAGETSIHAASARGHAGVVQRLVQKGARASGSINVFGETPLGIAIRNGHELTVKVLLENGAKLLGPKDEDTVTEVELDMLKFDEDVPIMARQQICGYLDIAKRRQLMESHK